MIKFVLRNQFEFISINKTSKRISVCSMHKESLHMLFVVYIIIHPTELQFMYLTPLIEKSVSSL